MSFIKQPIVILGGIILLLLFIGAVSGSGNKKTEQVTVLPSSAPSVAVKAETVQASVDPIVSSSPSLAPAPIVSPTPPKPSQNPSAKAFTKTETTQNPSGACKYSCTSPDKDCSDFSTHTEAQIFFDCCGFSSSNDPMRLDRATGAGNGKACESLP